MTRYRLLSSAGRICSSRATLSALAWKGTLVTFGFEKGPKRSSRRPFRAKVARVQLERLLTLARLAGRLPCALSFLNLFLFVFQRQGACALTPRAYDSVSPVLGVVINRDRHRI